MKKNKISKIDLLDRIMKYVLIFFVFLLIGSVSYDYVLLPSYTSILSNCVENGEEKIKEMGFAIGGYYEIEVNETTNEVKDTLFVNETIGEWYGIDKIFKHENIHRLQAKNKNFYGCDKIIYKYLNEVEANIGQYLPDGVYNAVYRD